MNRLDWTVIFFLVALVGAILPQHNALFRSGEIGRRPPLVEAPPPAPTPPPAPVRSPERRRPPLVGPGERDPLVDVKSEEPPSHALLLGTAFSVDPRGVWLTARHVVGSATCERLVMVVNGAPVPARIAYLHPQSDLAVLRTATGTEAMPLATAGLALGESGFTFGYPTGVLGATEDELLGRSRMRLGGRVAGITPVLTWAEERRFPDTLATLGGMSGGPMLDDSGRVIGILVAATVRRGRVHSVAPELLRQVERDTALFAPARRDNPIAEIARDPHALEANAVLLSRTSRIAKVYCRVE